MVGEDSTIAVVVRGSGGGGAADAADGSRGGSVLAGRGLLLRLLLRLELLVLNLGRWLRKLSSWLTCPERCWSYVRPIGKQFLKKSFATLQQYFLYLGGG